MWRDSGGVQKKYVARRHLEEVKAQCALYLACQLELTRLVRERDALWHEITRRNGELQHLLFSIKNRV